MMTKCFPTKSESSSAPNEDALSRLLSWVSVLKGPFKTILVWFWIMSFFWIPFCLRGASISKEQDNRSVFDNKMYLNLCPISSLCGRWARIPRCFSSASQCSCLTCLRPDNTPASSSISDRYWQHRDSPHPGFSNWWPAGRFWPACDFYLAPSFLSIKKTFTQKRKQTCTTQTESWELSKNTLKIIEKLAVVK